MSTATNTSTTTQFDHNGKSIFWRFMWKEFRMIRSLWAAVAIMGLLVQWAEGMLLPYSSERPMMLLYTALAAAVLYAAGAAATTFSVEHEEETFDLLVRLPTVWWPSFAGKLVVTLVSALLLACLLSISALMSHGPNFTGQDARNALGVMGFAILEAVAWGTLFSLLIKRPLLAAIVTLVVGAVTVNLVVTYSSTFAASALSPEAYFHALPRRLAIVVAVFTCSLYFASDWLTPGTRLGLAAHLRISRLMTWLAGGRSRAREVTTAVERVPHRRLLARLLWQSWRESWKLLLAPLGVAFLLLAGMSAATGLARQFNEATSFVISSGFLFAPTLYGAMAFYADQRRGNFRFLAEHAARPRYIWLARHIIWLGALSTVWFLLIGGFAAFVGTRMELSSRQMLEEYLVWREHATAVSLVYDVAFGSQIALRILSAASFGALVAYGIGQLFSMTIRSEILAAFLALLVTFVVAAWVWVVGLWQLSVVQFLFPLFAGLMLATWLRAPDWIAGRNSWRAWWKPALAVIAPVLLVAAMLPSARLAQMRREKPASRDQLVAQENRDRDFAARLTAFQAGDTTEAAQTADMYTRAATKLTAGTDQDLFERWRKPEYLETNPSGPPGSTEINETKLPPDQLKAYRNSQRQQANLIQQSIATTINEAIEISKRPSCRFHFDAGSLAPNPCNCIPPDSVRPQPCGLAYNKTYQNINQLIGAVAGGPINQHEEPRHFLAALRMGQHLRSGQPSVVVIDQLKAEQFILARIAGWALESDRTKEELRDALDKLTAQLYSLESAADGLLADHLLIRSVIEGREMPFILSTTPIEPHAYLAYLANQLWWERERAGKALDKITRGNITDLENLIKNLNNTVPREVGIGEVRHWLRPDYSGLPEPWQIMNPAAATSYLVSLEYQARVPIFELNRAYCDNATYRHATLLQIALALYRLDHKKYPTQLADLVPEYLEQLPLDPYARQPFQYQPTGLALPLRFYDYGHGYRLGYERLETNTPVFWSVGVGNVRLKEVERAKDPDPNNPPPDGEIPPSQKPERQYEFVNDDQVWWNNNTLTFPLPK